MSFSEAFARGYAIGDASRQRSAAAKYFKLMQKLTKSSEEEKDTTLVGGLPVPSESMTAPATAALPIQSMQSQAGVSTTQDAAIPAPPAVDTSAVDTAVHDPNAGAKKSLEEAIPITGPVTDVAVKAPKVLISKPQSSLKQSDIRDLDRAAMRAAQAAGNIEVYTALQKTTDSFLQGKVMSNLGDAMTAVQNGDIDGTEAALHKAYRFIPDGRQAKFIRRNGKLWIKDPYSEKGELVELNAQRIGAIGMMMQDPVGFSKYIREGMEKDKEAKIAERGVAVQEKNAQTNVEQLAEARRSNMATERSNMATELNATGKLDLDKANSVADNLYKLSMATYYGAGGAGQKGASDSLPPGMKPDDARQYGESVGAEIENFLSPKLGTDPQNPELRGEPQPGYEVFGNYKAGKDGKPEYAGGISNVGHQAKAYGGQVGIWNPGIGPATAARAGMEIARAMIPGSGVDVGVDPASGTLEVTIDGAPYSLNINPSTISALYQAKLAEQSPGPPRRK